MRGDGVRLMKEFCCEDQFASVERPLADCNQHESSI